MAAMMAITDANGRPLAELYLGEFYRSYVLGPGERIPVIQCIAWCYRCGAFVAAERLPSFDEIDREIAAIRAGNTTTGRALRGLDPAKDSGYQSLVDQEQGNLERWEKTREWRSHRCSPARCLEC